MKQEILDKIKRSYEIGLNRKKYYSSILEELKKLEQDKKRYIELKRRLEQLDYKKIIGESEEEILIRALEDWQYEIMETNNIYVYYGTFMIENNLDINQRPRDIRLERNDPRADYRIYRNIEDGFSEVVLINRSASFEKEHTVIFPKVDNQSEQFFYEIQKEFIKTSINEGQIEAHRKILRKTVM